MRSVASGPVGQRWQIGHLLMAVRRIQQDVVYGSRRPWAARHACADTRALLVPCLPMCSMVLTTASNQTLLLTTVRARWIIAPYAEVKLSIDAVVAEVVEYKRDVQWSFAASTRPNMRARSCVWKGYCGRWTARIVHCGARVFGLLDVEEVFLCHFVGFLSRRRLLVPTGPSGLGKTNYIRPLSADPRIRSRIRETAFCQSDQPDQAPVPSHGGGTEFWEVCAHGYGSALPDVRPFACCARVALDRRDHAGIGHQQRRVLQSKADWAAISGSATTLYASNVCSWGAQIVGTANDWRERTAVLAEPDQLWLVESSIGTDVRAPLWQHAAAIS